MIGLRISGVLRIQYWLSTETIWSARVHGPNIWNITARTNSTAILGYRVSLAVFIGFREPPKIFLAVEPWNPRVAVELVPTLNIDGLEYIHKVNGPRFDSTSIIESYYIAYRNYKSLELDFVLSQTIYFQFEGPNIQLEISNPTPKHSPLTLILEP